MSEVSEHVRSLGMVFVRNLGTCRKFRNVLETSERFLSEITEHVRNLGMCRKSRNGFCRKSRNASEVSERFLSELPERVRNLGMSPNRLKNPVTMKMTFIGKAPQDLFHRVY